MGARGTFVLRDVRVDLSTHAIGGLSLPDLVLAAKIDALDVEYSPKWLREQAAREAASDVAAAAADDSVALTVFEGEAAEALEVWRLPGWEAVRALERADLPGRVGGTFQKVLSIAAAEARSFSQRERNPYMLYLEVAERLEV